MKELNIKMLKVTNTFHNGLVSSDYLIIYEDMSYQIFDLKDLSENDMHRITEFMRKSKVVVRVRRYPKSNITRTVGKWF
jgi:hypothetical protein